MAASYRRTSTIERRELERAWDGRLTVIEEPRPKTRGDCHAVTRPCVWVGCKWNLYLDAMPSGSIKLNHPSLEPDEMLHSCALDVARRGGVTEVFIGKLLGISKQAVQYVIAGALESAKAATTQLGVDGEP